MNDRPWFQRPIFLFIPHPFQIDNQIMDMLRKANYILEFNKAVSQNASPGTPCLPSRKYIYNKYNVTPEMLKARLSVIETLKIDWVKCQIIAGITVSCVRLATRRVYRPSALATGLASGSFGTLTWVYYGYDYLVDYLSEEACGKVMRESTHIVE